MIGVRHHAGQCPQCLSPLLILTIIPLFLFCETIHGQPNYYFKASAPAVKSLPRIGRRSQDVIMPSGLSGDAPAGGPYSFGRSVDLMGGGMIEMWPNSGNAIADTSSSNFGVGSGSGMRNSLSSSRDRGDRAFLPPPSSLVAPSSISSSNQMLEKSVLWRRLLGDLNNYEDVIDNIYHAKT